MMCLVLKPMASIGFSQTIACYCGPNSSASPGFKKWIPASSEPGGTLPSCQLGRTFGRDGTGKMTLCTKSPDVPPLLWGSPHSGNRAGFTTLQ